MLGVYMSTKKSLLQLRGKVEPIFERTSSSFITIKNQKLFSFSLFQFQWQKKVLRFINIMGVNFLQLYPQCNMLATGDPPKIESPPNELH